MFGGTAVNLCSLFRGRKFLKLLKKLTVFQAVPEIPLSVGSKLQLLRAFVFARFPYTSNPYTHAFVCICILPCILLYMTEVQRVLHFSAFIIMCDCISPPPPPPQLSCTEL